MNFLKPLVAVFLLSILTFGCKDECSNIICNNGGVCINGQCDCPDRYTGPACDSEKMPASMSVGSVTLADMPSLSNGQNWDLLDGPDVYFTIEKDGQSVYTSNTSYNSFVTTWNTSVIFNEPSEIYVIRVFDEDTISPDYIGGITFTPYVSGRDFPNVISLSCPECNVTLTFTDINYNF